jgi:hypothetical protein
VSAPACLPACLPARSLPLFCRSCAAFSLDLTSSASFLCPCSSLLSPALD